MKTHLFDLNKIEESVFSRCSYTDLHPYQSTLMVQLSVACLRNQRHEMPIEDSNGCNLPRKKQGKKTN